MATGTEPTAHITDLTPPGKVERVREKLLAWFHANRRDLPWRHTRDPYAILVSEVMLQQTQVDRVIPYFERWLAQFPTVEALAAAPAADVIRAWSGLGYNRRAVNLQRTVQAVVEEHGGVFPNDVDTLRKLPGIGPYTAGAIACFAFGRDTAFADTNIRRVLHRLFAGVDVPGPSLSDRQVQELAKRVLPPGHAWDWNQGLIEFGALQCTARKPLCLVCPLQTDCAAFPAIQTALAELPKGTRLKREAPFKESNRYFRGRVVEALREREGEPGPTGLTLTEIGPKVRENFTPADIPWLYEVVQGLARDGLARVAEPASAYDANGQSSDIPVEELRVRLP